MHGGEAVDGLDLVGERVADGVGCFHDLCGAIVVSFMHGIGKMGREKDDAYELFVGISDPEEDSEDVRLASFGM